MAHTPGYSEDWRTLPWKVIQRRVFRRQRRIYQAARRNDVTMSFTVSSVYDNDPYSEKPDEVKVSRPVWEWRRGRRLPRRP